MYRVGYVTSISNTFSMRTSKDLYVLIIETRDWKFKLIIKQFFIRAFRISMKFLFYSFILYFYTLKYMENIWRV